MGLGGRYMEMSKALCPTVPTGCFLVHCTPKFPRRCVDYPSFQLQHLLEDKKIFFFFFLVCWLEWCIISNLVWFAGWSDRLFQAICPVLGMRKVPKEGFFWNPLWLSASFHLNSTVLFVPAIHLTLNICHLVGKILMCAVLLPSAWTQSPSGQELCFINLYINHPLTTWTYHSTNPFWMAEKPRYFF